MGEDRSWSCVWIVGASSGIGEALALRMARDGVNVAVSARSQDPLDKLAARSPQISSFPLDASNQDAVWESEAAIRSKFGAIDLVVYCAGVWFEQAADDFDASKCVTAMAVNHNGAAFVTEAVLPAMLDRGGGHIAFVGSVAGYRGLPRASAYAPSKAALLSLAETLHLELSRKGICVTIVSPGFVETPMTAENDFEMPYIMSAEDAAERIYKGLKRRPFEIAFPWQLVWSLKLARTLPNWIWFPLARWQFYGRTRR